MSISSGVKETQTHRFKMAPSVALYDSPSKKSSTDSNGCSSFPNMHPISSLSIIQGQQYPCYNTMSATNGSIGSSLDKSQRPLNQCVSGLNTSQNVFIPDNNSDGKDDHEETNSLIERIAKRVPGFGIVLALMASLFLGSAGLLVKVTHSVHGIQVAVFRALIQLIVYTLIVVANKQSFRPAPGELLPVVVRAILGSISITCSYTALKLIPLGDATTIRFSLPIWTLIIGHVFLKEPCYVINMAAVLISIVGVALIAKPKECIEIVAWITGHETLHEIIPHPEDFNVRRVEGSLIALTSSICLAISFIALRLCKKTQASVVIYWLSLSSVAVGVVMLAFMNELNLPNNWLDLIKIVMNGICGAIGQYMITMALKVEESGPISLARTFDIVVAFFFSAVLLHEEIKSTSIIGSVLVSSSVVSVILSKWFGPNLCFKKRSLANKKASAAGSSS